MSVLQLTLGMRLEGSIEGNELGDLYLNFSHFTASEH